MFSPLCGVNPFFSQLTAEGRQYGYFQQDNATAHMANAAMVAIREVSEDKIISRGLWPPTSQFLRFLSLGKPKGKSLQGACLQAEGGQFLRLL
jgi:hypothetical protein